MLQSSSKSCSKCGESFVETALYCPRDGTSLIKEDTFIGKVLDSKYKIESFIGEGGMGNVYQAKHLHIGFPVAIKILHKKLLTDPTAVERFRREARSARAVNHPNAIQIMDFGITSDNILYIVMELIIGISLQKVLEKETILNAARVIKLMRQICLALDVAHRKSIVHRDLKPDNILIINAGTFSETVKVIDFSIAKIKQTGDDPNITRDNIAVGTPQYLSPEQAQGLKELDHRADIYSLGIILYQMLTGTVPFNSKTTAMTLLQHIQAKPKAPREINPNIPIALEKVILKAIAKTPSSRQQTVLELLEELELSIPTPESFATKLDTPIIKKEVKDFSSKESKEAEIATELAIPAIKIKTTPNKTPVVKTTDNKDLFQKSGKLFNESKNNILPALQDKAKPKKGFLKRVFSWFRIILSN
ncbi:MAG: serine/threonine protein kinase [Blastocatellia bacterium]|nr:serine/threonine protein kinase [Blastocatellia bacterium]